MQILEIDGCTRVLGESQGYRGLYIRDEQSEDGNVMISEWALTDEEISRLKSGGTLLLSVYGSGHPPVKLEISA